MRTYSRLTRDTRYQLQALLDRGFSFRSIAKQLELSPSTVSREVARCGLRSQYQAHWADFQASQRQSLKRLFQSKVQGSIQTFVDQRLHQDWSPEQIAGYLFRKHGRPLVSFQTIYRYVEFDKSRGGKLWKHLRILRRQGKDRKKPTYRAKSRYGVQNRVHIEQRSPIVDQRIRIGDYERDTVLGVRGGSVLLTIVDRKSRLLKLRYLPKKLSKEVYRATWDSLKNEIVHTITNDNGSEFADHEQTAKRLKANVYFSQSFRSWDRGTNENMNGLVRQYFPKKRDIGKPTKKQIQAVEDRINNRPRKCLGYQTPLEVHEMFTRQALR